MSWSYEKLEDKDVNNPAPHAYVAQKRQRGSAMVHAMFAFMFLFLFVRFL
jgi:hypothetical protein